MKQYINKFLLLSGCALAFAACDENSWNDKLDGFEEPVPTDVQSIEYTLTAADYALIASNSTNKAIAGDEFAAALSAVGKQGYFTSEITAEKYVPALLTDPKFPYFALSNGSSVKVTYQTAGELPQQIEDMVNAEKYTVTEADYQSVWGSEDDYTNAFTPAHPASSAIPALLKEKYAESAVADDYVIVNYNTSDVDPDFGTPEPEFELTSVLGSISVNDQIDVNGYVAAVGTQGPVVCDATGSIFVYAPTNNADLKVGDQVTFSATVSSYNYGFQTAKGATVEVVGTQEVTYPAAKTWTGAEIDQFVAEKMAAGAALVTPVYSKFTGTVTVSGNYINVILDGTTVQVSPYGATNALKAQLTDGATVTFEGYVMALASKGKYLNTIVTKVGSTAITTQSVNAADTRAMVSVPSVNENAIYKYDGSNWVAAPSTVILSHADYQAMGQSYDNLSGTVPATLLPTYLGQKYPYAVADQQVFVVYYYYNGSATVTRCDEYTFDGSNWTLNDGVVTETAQFVKSNGNWNYDPSLVITLPVGRNQPLSTLYFQTCVDWVRDNVPDGAAFVTSYGNNEYYCGTSAYQGNIDLRASAAKAQYAGYDSMTDEEVIALEKERFANEVMPGALAILHPDMRPVDGVDVTVTIHFGVYSGKTISAPNAVVVYSVTAPATFELVSIEWPE